MKLKIKTTFSFPKLVEKYDSLVEGLTVGIAEDMARKAKHKISKGLKPALKRTTTDIRKSRGVSGKTPLIATGSLLKSIKINKNKLTMNAYGKLHNDGFITDEKSMIPNKNVPPRPFLPTTMKVGNKEYNKFIKELKKALRK